MDNPTSVGKQQIDNLRQRLFLTRQMQVLGLSSLCLCVITMFLIFVGLNIAATWIFGIALILLIGSLGVSIREIQISTRALEIHLSDMSARIQPPTEG